MNLKSNVMFIGVGNCGCKNAKIQADNDYPAMFVNGSEQDLKLLGNVKNIYKLKGFDGFGGRREKALDCLQQNMELLEALQQIEQKIVFILYGAGGSTGAGLSTYILEQLLEDVDDESRPTKIVCPVPFLPALNEPIGKHRNAYQSAKELQDINGLGATFFINNSAGNANSNSDLKWINNTFSKLLDSFLTDESVGELNNFDTSERLEMLRDPGAMILSLTGRDKQEMLIDKLTKTGIFAPIENDKKCGLVGIIHAAENDVNTDAIVSEVGKPLNIFEGYGGKNTLVAVSGLTYPIEHITKLGQLAKQGIEERKRSQQSSVKKLSDLDLEEEMPVIKHEPVKKPSKLELLKQMKAAK